MPWSGKRSASTARIACSAVRSAIVTGERSDFSVGGDAGAEERPDHSARDIGGGLGRGEIPVDRTRGCAGQAVRCTASPRPVRAAAAGAAPPASPPRRLGRVGRRQRLGVVRQGAQIGDHVGPLLVAVDAGERHAGAGRIGARLVQPLVQFLVGPGALLALQRGGVVEALHVAVRRADHAVQVWPDPGLAALVEGVAGDADLLGERLAGRRIGRGEQRRDRRQCLRLRRAAAGRGRRAPSMFSAGFSGSRSRTRLSPIRPVRKKAMPATRTAAMPLLTSMLSMRRDFPVHARSQTRAEARPARRCARPFASIRCAHHRETIFAHQPTELAREPDRRHPRPHGLHAAARQAARRHPRPADDRARARPRRARRRSARSRWPAAMRRSPRRCARRAACAVLTDPALPSRLRPGARGAGGTRSRRAGTTSWSTCKATCRPSRRRICAPCWRRWPTRRVDIATLVAPIASDEEADTAVVREGRLRVRPRPRRSAGAVFLARADPLGRRAALAPCRHLRLSPRRAGALRRAAAKSPLERREKLEQLRALEAGMRIACARVEHGPFGVDTPADLERARRLLAPAAAAMTRHDRLPGHPRAPIPTSPAAPPIRT